MIKSILLATAALAMMGGIAIAQLSSSSSTTTQITTPMAPSLGIASESSSQRTIDSNGVVTDKTQTYTSGATILTPAGDTSTTSKTSETTTVR